MRTSCLFCRKNLISSAAYNYARHQNRILNFQRCTFRFFLLLSTTLAASMPEADGTSATSKVDLYHELIIPHLESSVSSQVFLLTTVEGDVLTLDAATGNIINAFSSGDPLVSASSNILSSLEPFASDDSCDEDDEEEHQRPTQPVFVPGLDGNLYIRRPEDEAWDSVIHIPDLVDNPIQTCQTVAGLTECGIVSANVVASLFSLDIHGKLQWQQPATSSSSKHQHHTTTSKGGAVLLLQRKDYTVQQISTSTGEQVWNLTWGRLEAVDFFSGGQEGLLPYSNNKSNKGNRNRLENQWFGPYDATAIPSKSERQHYRHHHQQPIVAFGDQGKTFMAVEQSTGKLLWKREFPTMLASVFSINKGTWQRVEVLDEKLVVLQQTAGGAFTDYGVTLRDSYANNNNHDDINVNREAIGWDDHVDQLYWWLRNAHPYYSSFNQLERIPTFNQKSSKDLVIFSPTRWRDKLYRYLDNLRLQNQLSSFFFRHDRFVHEISPHVHMWHDRYERNSIVWHNNNGHDQLISPTMALLPSSIDDNGFTSVGTNEGAKMIELIPTNTMHAQQSLAQGGVFLSWPLVVALLLGLIAIVLLALLLYLRKKRKWKTIFSSGVEISASNPSIATTATIPDGCGEPDQTITKSADGGSFVKQLHRRCSNSTTLISFHRSNSLPTHLNYAPILSMDKYSGNPTPLSDDGNRKAVVPSPGDNSVWKDAHLPVSSDSVNMENCNGAHLPLSRARSQPHKSINGSRTVSTTNIPSPLATAFPVSPKQDVGLIDGMPLIRYSRYQSDFRELERLGKGGFGTVFRCTNVIDLCEYAVKKIVIKSDIDSSGTVTEAFSQELQRVRREVKILASLDHPNIVRYYTAWLEMEEESSAPLAEDLDESCTSDNFTTGHPTTTMSRCFSSELLTSLDRRNQKNNTISSSGVHRRLDNNKKQPLSNPLGWTNFSEDSFSPTHFPKPLATLEGYGFTFEDRSSSNLSLRDANINNNMDVGDDVLNEHSSSSSSSDSCSSESAEESSLDIDATETRASTRVAVNKNDDANNNSEADCHILEQEQKQQQSPGSPTGKKPLGRMILYIQMQLCSIKTLADFLQNEEARKGHMSSNLNRVGVDIPVALNLFQQIAQAVKQIHAQGLIHRDLKPNNCFIDDSGRVKVGDFGLSRESGGRAESNTATTLRGVNQKNLTISNDGVNYDDNTAGVGTRSYASPEQMNGSDYDSSTDIYALGIILFELCYPMYTRMERYIVLNRLRSNRTFPDQWLSSVAVSFPLLHELVRSMISPQRSDRPSADLVARQVDSLLEEHTLFSLNGVGEDGDKVFYLKVEALPREDVLQCTIKRIQEAAAPKSLEIVHYGLRGSSVNSSNANGNSVGGGAKAIMEFALSIDSTSTASNAAIDDKKHLGEFVANMIVNLEKHSEVILARHVFHRPSPVV